MLDGSGPATPTDAQKTVMHAAGAAVMGANATTAMNALGLTWGMFTAPILGMVGGDVPAAIQSKAFSCLTVTHFGISNYSAASNASKALATAILVDKLTNGTFYSNDQIQANLTAITGPGAVQSWAASLPANFIIGWNSTVKGWNASDSSDVTVSAAVLSIPLISALVTAMGTAAGQGLNVNVTAFELEVGAIAVALANSTALTTPASDTAFGVLQYSIGAVFLTKSFNVTAGNATEVEGVVQYWCGEAPFDMDPECIQSSLPVVWTFFQTFWRTHSWIKTQMNPTSVQAAIGAIIMSTADVRMVTNIGNTMEPCFNGPLNALKPLLDTFSRLGSGAPAGSDMAIATGLALGTGCGLAKAGMTAGADPDIANMQSCYLLAIAQKSPALLSAAKTKQFTKEQIFGMKDSMGNVQARCTAVDYPLGRFPGFTDKEEPATKAPTTGTPTTPPSTAPPTTTKLSNAINLHPALALVAAALLALL
jgi:hypothetical protein